LFDVVANKVLLVIIESHLKAASRILIVLLLSFSIIFSNYNVIYFYDLSNLKHHLANNFEWLLVPTTVHAVLER
jgi:hypothetical protein